MSFGWALEYWKMMKEKIRDAGIFENITPDTVLQDGDWVKRKNSTEIFQIMNTGQSNIFQIVRSGMNGTLESGRVTTVLLLGELIKHYQRRVGVS